MTLLINQDESNYGKYAKGKIIHREMNFALSDRSEVYVASCYDDITGFLEAFGYKQGDDYAYTRDYNMKIKNVDKLMKMTLPEKLVYLDRTWLWSQRINNPYDDVTSLVETSRR